MVYIGGVEFTIGERVCPPFIKGKPSYCSNDRGIIDRCDGHRGGQRCCRGIRPTILHAPTILYGGYGDHPLVVCGRGLTTVSIADAINKGLCLGRGEGSREVDGGSHIHHSDGVAIAVCGGTHGSIGQGDVAAVRL